MPEGYEFIISFSYFLPLQSCVQFNNGNWIEIYFAWVLDSIRLKSQIFLVSFHSYGEFFGNNHTSCVLSWHHVQTMLLDLVKQDCYNLLQSNNRVRLFEILEENKSQFRVTKMVLSVTHDLRTMYVLFHNVLSLRKNIGIFGKG